ncbi:hypothetical protein [Haloferula sp.]|uniref:hypothetical protein n=1 Tax=Haloferula sp. TaxID=2497595 RepID=UPI003C796871
MANLTHFACPACQGAVAVPIAARPRLQVAQALSSAVPVPAPAAPQKHALATAHRGLSRNLLILGCTVLLVLGGLGFFLASQMSGDTKMVNQDIRNEIIKNFYFQQLIASGATNEAALRRMEMIFPHKDGFVGISDTPLTWDAAGDLASQTASVILPFDSSAASANREILERIAPSAAGQSLWVSVQGVCATLSEAGTARITSQGGSRKALFRWDTQVKGDPTDSRFDPQIPEPDAEGWITLFDGEKLYGCSAEDIIANGDKVKIEDGTLILDDAGVQFQIIARNVAIRADVKKISGINLGLGCRQNPGNRKYNSWFNGGGARYSNFGLGMAAPKWREIKAGKASRNFRDFFQMELMIQDSTITLKAEDELVASAENSEIDEPGKLSVRALRGRGLFKNIQVKILDNAP